jgi:hypothetical protein
LTGQQLVVFYELDRFRIDDCGIVGALRDFPP